MIVVSEPCSERFCAVYIDGPLLAPVNQELATEFAFFWSVVSAALCSTSRAFHLSTPRALAFWPAHTPPPAPWMRLCGSHTQPNGYARLSSVSACSTF
jgi:hypothetical protein